MNYDLLEILVLLVDYFPYNGDTPDVVGSSDVDLLADLYHLHSKIRSGLPLVDFVGLGFFSPDLVVFEFGLIVHTLDDELDDVVKTLACRHRPLVSNTLVANQAVLESL